MDKRYVIGDDTMHVKTQVRAYVCVYACMRKYTYTSVLMDKRYVIGDDTMHVKTQVRAYIYMYVHTYTCMCICMYV